MEAARDIYGQHATRSGRPLQTHVNQRAGKFPTYNILIMVIGLARGVVTGVILHTDYGPTGVLYPVKPWTSDQMETIIRLQSK